MAWNQWANSLLQEPKQAVTDLLRGVADILPYERAGTIEFLLAVLPRESRTVQTRLLGEPAAALEGKEPLAGSSYVEKLDDGLVAWLMEQQGRDDPPVKKIASYAAQFCDAFQCPMYFVLPKTSKLLLESGVSWDSWFDLFATAGQTGPDRIYRQLQDLALKESKQGQKH